MVQQTEQKTSHWGGGEGYTGAGPWITYFRRTPCTLLACFGAQLGPSCFENTAPADVSDFEPSRLRWGARVGHSGPLGLGETLEVDPSSPLRLVRARETCRSKQFRHRGGVRIGCSILLRLRWGARMGRSSPLRRRLGARIGRSTSPGPIGALALVVSRSNLLGPLGR